MSLENKALELLEEAEKQPYLSKTERAQIAQVYAILAVVEQLRNLKPEWKPSNL
jgi:hypothetical protein